MADPTVPILSIWIVDPPRFVSDHMAVKLKLVSSTISDHSRYLHNRSQLPAVHLETNERGPNHMFAQLMEYQTQTPPTVHPPRDTWIKADTWALIDHRNAALQWAAPQEELCQLRKAIRRKIKWDRETCLQITGTEIETHLDAEDPKEARRLVKLWYCHNVCAPLPPRQI